MTRLKELRLKCAQALDRTLGQIPAAMDNEFSVRTIVLHVSNMDNVGDASMCVHAEAQVRFPVGSYCDDQVVEPTVTSACLVRIDGPANWGGIYVPISSMALKALDGLILNQVTSKIEMVAIVRAMAKGLLIDAKNAVEKRYQELGCNHWEYIYQTQVAPF